MVGKLAFFSKEAGRPTGKGLGAWGLGGQQSERLFQYFSFLRRQRWCVLGIGWPPEEVFLGGLCYGEPSYGKALCLMSSP